MRIAIALALLALAPAALEAQTDQVNTDRLSIASSGGSPAVGTVRLGGLGTTGGTEVLFTDANRDVIRRVLARADLPTAIVYDDEANTFTGAGAQIFRSTVSETASGADEVRIGVATGSPRVILEDSGQTQWEIDNTAGVLRLFTPGFSRFELQSAGSLTLKPPNGAVLPGAPYEGTLGSPVQKWLAVYAAELNVETLVAQDTLATTGGRVLVGPTTALIEDIDTAATTIKVKHNNIANGDRVIMESDGRVEFLAVTSAATRINRCSSNCSVESGTTNYVSDGTVALAQSATFRWRGGSSLRWTYTSGTANVYRSVATELANSTQFTASIFVRRADGAAVVPTGSAYQMYIDSTGATVTPTAQDMGDGWYRLYGTRTTGGAANNIVGLTLIPTGTVHYFDAWQIETGATVTAWSETSSSYTVTRDLDGTGANIWEAGTAVFNTGTTGNGFIDLYSLRGVKASTEVGPAIVGNVRTGTGYNAWAPRWAIGNLNGLYGYGSTTFGAAFGDPSGSNITIDPTNGIRIRNSTTNQMVANAGNLSILSGALTIDTTGMSMAADTSFQDTRSYRFTGGTGSGRFGLYGLASTITRYIELNSISTVANGQGKIDITASDATNTSKISLLGGTAGGSATGSITVDAVDDVILRTGAGPTGSRFVYVGHTSPGSNVDFAFSTANSATSPGVPWFRTDGNYLVINPDTGDAVYIAWDTGSTIQMGAPTTFRGSAFPQTTNTWSLGSASLRWEEIWFDDNTQVTGTALFPVVSNGGKLMGKNDGLNGVTTCGGAQRVSSITFEFGIATAIVCS